MKKRFKYWMHLFEEFVPVLEQLLDEDMLLGVGWTTQESLRSIANSTVADLVHHVRIHLSLDLISKAVEYFSRNVHDDSLPSKCVSLFFCEVYG